MSTSTSVNLNYDENVRRRPVRGGNITDTTGSEDTAVSAAGTAVSAVADTAATSGTTFQSLIELNPDFVLQVSYAADKSEGDSNSDLNELLKVLDSKKFYLEIRPDKADTILVFVKLSDSALLKAVEDDEIKDWIYGVNNELLESKADIKNLSPAERLRIIYLILTSPISNGGCGITAQSGNWTHVKTILPVANYEIIQKQLKSTIFNISSFNTNENNKNINFILHYFGSKYAFYHYFLNTYINWLFPLTFIGFSLNLIFKNYSLIFTIVNLSWSIAFYLYWKLTQSKLVDQWGTKKISKVEIPMAENLTDNSILREPTYKKLIKQVFFLPLSLVFIGTLVGCQLFSFVVEIFLNEIYDGWLKSYLSLVPTVLLIVLVTIVTIFYNKFVSIYLKWEHHRTKSSYDYSNLIKTFIFNFLTSYMALLITSFIYLPFGFKLNDYLPDFSDHLTKYAGNITVKRSDFTVNQFRLGTQYQYFILTNQIVGLFMEFALPLILRKVLSHPKVKELLGKENDLLVDFQDNEKEKKFLTHVRKNLQLPDYDVNDDYRQLILQFGFLTMFGPVWSLGPLISLIINLIEQKLDYLKILSMVKSPVPDRSESIFPWDNCLKFLICVGSLTSVTISIMYNGDIVSSSSRSAVGIRWWKIVGPALIAEHLTVGIVKIGEIILDYYLSYLEENDVELEKDSDLSVRERYISSVYVRKNPSVELESKDIGNLNNIDYLLAEANSIREKLTTNKDIDDSKKFEKTINETEKVSEPNQILEKDNINHIDSKVPHVESNNISYNELFSKDGEIKDQIFLESVHNEKQQQLDELQSKKKELESLENQSLKKENQKIELIKNNNNEILETKKHELKNLEDSKNNDIQNNVAGNPKSLAQLKRQEFPSNIPVGNSNTIEQRGQKNESNKDQNGLDFEQGDKYIITKSAPTGEPVVATIDNNEHFASQNKGNDEDVSNDSAANNKSSSTNGNSKAADDQATKAEGDGTDIGNTTLDSNFSTRSSSTAKSKGSKNTLKSIFKKKHH